MTKEDVKRALEEQYGGEEEVNTCLDCFILLHLILIFILDLFI